MVIGRKEGNKEMKKEQLELAETYALIIFQANDPLPPPPPPPLAIGSSVVIFYNRFRWIVTSCFLDAKN